MCPLQAGVAADAGVPPASAAAAAARCCGEGSATAGATASVDGVVWGSAAAQAVPTSVGQAHVSTTARNSPPHKALCHALC